MYHQQFYLPNIRNIFYFIVECFQILAGAGQQSGEAQAPGLSSSSVPSSESETENRLESVESALRPVFKVENLQPGTQFRAVVFAKVDKYRTYRKQGSCHFASLSQANQST